MTWLLLTALFLLQSPPRDVAGPARVGTGVIAGTVVIDEAEAKPLRRVQVTLESGTIEIPRAAVTDDAGRFAFVGLAPGNYTLQAARPTYVPSFYGSKKPGRGPGVPIAVTAGQRVTGLTLKMLRGAVLTGIVRLPSGKPAAELAVQARGVVSGKALNQFDYGKRVTTNDRGEYRIYGLAPGDYVVQASAQNALPTGDMRRMTPAEIRDAQSAIRSAGSSAPAAAPPTPGPSINYAPVFFPGTTDQAAAQIITVVAGQERAGIDLTLQFVQTARMSGVALGPDGRPPQNLRITLSAKRSSVDPYSSFNSAVSQRPDGSFSATGLAPGRYTLTARAALASGAPAAPGGGRSGGAPPEEFVGGRPYVPPAQPLWGSAEFDINGRDVSGIVVNLQQGMNVSGKVIIESVTPNATLPPPDVARTRLSLVSAAAAPQPESGFVAVEFAGTSNSSGPVDKNGAFSIVGTAPGVYRFSVGAGTNGPLLPGIPTWTVKSIMVKGRDLADLPIEIKPGEDLTDVVITISNQETEISGTVFDQLNRPTPGFPIVVFSTNRGYWPAGASRVRKVQPASDGKFKIAGLPAGEYYVCAVTDIEETDLQDAAFLETLAAVSFKITLAPGEKKTQDLKLGGK